MSEFYLPSLLEPASSRLEILDSAGRFSSPLNGVTRTIGRPGERLRLSLTFQNLNAARRAALQSLAALRGATHRIWAMDHSHRIRGSFPATELLSNNTFADGTTGWTAQDGVLTVSDRVARLMATTPTASAQFRQSVALTQFVPYALRSVILDGAQSAAAGLSTGPRISDAGGLQVNDYQTARGLRTAVLVASSTGAANQVPALFISSTNGFTAGTYVEVPWCSLARCPLVDNSPNAFEHSDEIDNAYWNKIQLTVNANAHTAADGTATMEGVVENTANAQHTVVASATRASAAEDWCVSGVFVRATGTRDVRLVIGRDLSSNFSTCIFDLGAGTAGTPTNSGDNTNARAYIRDMGNGRYACFLVARLAASTNVSIDFDMVNGGAVSYTGDGSSAIGAWRFGAARSAVPMRVGQTTTAALPTGTSQALSGGLYIKGLPASTNGLLLPGDQVQIGNQLLIVTASLDSDALGLGFLQTAPSLRSAPADNAPVVINQPMGRFFLESDANGWSNKPGIFSDTEIVLAEAS